MVGLGSYALSGCSGRRFVRIGLGESSRRGTGCERGLGGKYILRREGDIRVVISE